MVVRGLLLRGVCSLFFLVLFCGSLFEVCCLSLAVRTCFFSFLSGVRGRWLFVVALPPVFACCLAFIVISCTFVVLVFVDCSRVLVACCSMLLYVVRCFMLVVCLLFC